MFVRYLSLDAVAAGATRLNEGEGEQQINDYYYLFQCVAISRQRHCWTSLLCVMRTWKRKAKQIFFCEICAAARTKRWKMRKKNAYTHSTHAPHSAKLCLRKPKRQCTWLVEIRYLYARTLPRWQRTDWFVRRWCWLLDGETRSFVRFCSWWDENADDRISPFAL